MKLFLLILFGVIKFSDEKPTVATVPEITTTEISVQPNENSTEILIFVTSPSETEEGKTETVSPTGNASKNSSDSENDADDDPETEIQLPVDLLSEDILLDPSVILARAERSLESLESVSLSKEVRDNLDVGKFVDGVPTFYFVKFIRVPRSIDQKLSDDGLEDHSDGRKIERVTRSTEEAETGDLQGADDGFIIRPLFKYRHEQLKRSNSRGYRNRDSYNYYPRYPIFPGK